MPWVPCLIWFAWPREQYSTWGYQDNFERVYFFLRKNLEPAKKHKPNQSQLIKQKQANKNNKGNNFLRRKTSKRGKVVYFAFLKKHGNCPDNLIYYTTELCSLKFVVIKLLLPIYPNSQDYMASSSRQATANTWDF